MKYSDYIRINSSFQRSTHIIFDANCDSYILSTSSVQALRRILVTNTANSMAITGPFGSGKSSFLIYLDALLVKNKASKICIENLEKKEGEIYSEYKKFVGNKTKGFFSIKMVAEHSSFKQSFINTLLEYKELKTTHQFIQKKNTSFTLLLKQLNKEVNELGYTGLLILIDELGKTIEYASAHYLESDIHSLQDLSEYANKHNNIRLVVALHKRFKAYVQNTSHTSFTEWDKIQGRFDSIIFQDDFYELMHIFEEAMTIENSDVIQAIKAKIDSIFKHYLKHVPHKQIAIEQSSLIKLAPLHPFSSLALFHIFSKYFQNQRSVFSFLSAQEPYSFQSFLNKDNNIQSLYTLDCLFDYINYLSNAYTVNMVDKESWVLANEYLESANILTTVQQQIIKAIALISAFGLEHLIQLDKKTLELALYNVTTVHEELKALKAKGLILFRLRTHSFVLIEEVSINIDEELSNIINNQIKINYSEEINTIIKEDKILAKRFAIETGTAKFFSKEYIDTDIGESKNLKFKVIYIGSDISKKDIIEVSLENKYCIYLSLPLSTKIKKLIDKSLAIHTLLAKKETLLNQRISKLLNGMLVANKDEIDKILSIKGDMYFCGKHFVYSSEQLQQHLSCILKTIYSKMPIIINDLVNPVQTEISVPIGMKKLFEQMINNEQDKNLGIEKFPAQMAIYLSVIKRSGFHKEKQEQYRFSKPNNNNFTPIWEKLATLIKTQEQIKVDGLLHCLSKEPYGLNEIAVKFVVFLYLIIYERKIHFFRENTYQFDFDIDQLMDVWKNSKLYSIRWYNLSDNETIIFEKYIQIFDEYIDTGYSKKNIKDIFQKLYNNFNTLPKYCHQTNLLSKQAIKLRSGLLASKEPHALFFHVFPNSLGYKQLDASNIDHFITEFKSAFNEIVFSYKKILQDIEQCVVKAFKLSNTHYPFNHELDIIFKKYSSEYNDKQCIAINRAYNSAIDMRSFLNGLSLVLNHKKIDNAFDHDIIELKHNIGEFSNTVLSKLDVIDLINKRPVDVKKLTISGIDSNEHLVISVKKEKVPQLIKQADDLLNHLENKELSHDEKLYLMTIMAETLQGNK